MVCRANVQLNVSVLLRLLVPFLGGTAESAPQIPQEGKVKLNNRFKNKIPYLSFYHANLLEMKSGTLAATTRETNQRPKAEKLSIRKARAYGRRQN